MVSMGEVADFFLAAYPGTIASKGRVPRVLGASGASMVVESKSILSEVQQTLQTSRDSSYVTDSGSRFERAVAPTNHGALHLSHLSHLD